MTILGVLSGGPATLGFPFNKLFTTTAHIASAADVEKLKISAVLLWGGEDISPSLYGQKASVNFCDASDTPSKRDLLEWSVMQKALQLNVPIIGVCRGAQILCAFDGGTLAQDVSNHQCRHNIVTVDGFSFPAPGDHHQMMLPGKGPNKVLAWADVPRAQFYIGENNTIIPFPPGFKEPEAVFFPDVKGIGFQYHPEWDQIGSKCIEWTLEKVKEYFL